MKFDRSFVFGAATAAYQAEGAVNEGGRIPNYWDRSLHLPESRFNADISCDFYHRYWKDLENAKSLGIKAVRISIAWSRIILNEKDEVNQEGVDYYNKVIDAVLANGMEPFVTLHHFDTPLIFHDRGDWLDEDTIEHFIRFSEVCFKSFGNRVRHWITINEPWSVVGGQYIIGHFPPNIKYDIAKAVTALHNMMIAHSRCAVLYKSLGFKGEIGIIHILESKYPLSDCESDKKAAFSEDVLANTFLLDATFLGLYQKATLKEINRILNLDDESFVPTPQDLEILKQGSEHTDFLGLNYYASHFLAACDGESCIRHNGSGEKGTSLFRLKGIGERKKNPEVPATDWDWPIYPEGLYDMLIRIKKDYGSRKIYITENGLGAAEQLENRTVEDDQRIFYLEKHLEAVKKALQKGVRIEGYFIWSLMDLFSWTNGYKKRYGLFYIDYDTQKRYPKKSALWFKAYIEGACS